MLNDVFVFNNSMNRHVFIVLSGSQVTLIGNRFALTY